MMKLRVLCTALLLGLLVASPAAAGLIKVSILPPAQVVQPGEVVKITIVANIPAEWAIVGWGMDLGVSGGFLSLNGFAIGPDFDPVVGQDGDGLGGLVPPPGTAFGDVLLATFWFTAGTPSSQTVHDLAGSDDNAAGDLTEGFAISPNLGGGFADVQYNGATVTVKPEPATLALLAFGALAMIRRRR